MRWADIIRLACAAILVCNGTSTPAGIALQQRQAISDTATPKLTSSDGGTPSTPSSTASPTDQPSDQTSSSNSLETTSVQASDQPSSAEPSNELRSTANSNSTVASSSTRYLTAPSSAPTNGTAAHEHEKEDQLPIKPRITPALAIGGVILILTGIVYNLVGVKNRWAQISLSTTYLSGLAITVLIDYVMHPPVSDGIQGAYFVGIFVTGLIFAAGSLIFTEVTEGLGCLLGGFCVSMWFLTLKPGGMITSQTGKGIFIAIFCAVAWSLSFSHHTRAYGLIASTAFSGATAFVLGVDCFSRAGLKEFWFYIWALNDDLFPLGTTTYPMTKGIRVEIVIIVLGTIIGVISQIKLWKIVRDKQMRREEARQDEERRKDVVEQVIGRQLERQNDKDRSNWEKQYGNSLQSKRSTILWSDAHPDQSCTHIPNLAKRSSSSESLEMSSYRGNRQSKLKRQSSAVVYAIQEETEDRDTCTSMEREKALITLEDVDSKEGKEVSADPVLVTNIPPEVVPLPFKIPTMLKKPIAKSSSDVNSGGTSHPPEPRRFSKRQSLQSMLSLSPRLSTEKLSPSESQEALILGEPIHSRASSVAATLDDENDLVQLGSLPVEDVDEIEGPDIVFATAAFSDDQQNKSKEGTILQDYVEDVPPSPPALPVSFDIDDPEELARPAEAAKLAPRQKDAIGGEIRDKRMSKETKTSSTLNSGAKQSFGSYDNLHNATGQTTPSEVLTKGYLDQVPSQVSNVVMSYRTNEWAKHISTADAPVYDTPEMIVGPEDEAPIQLVLTSPMAGAPPSKQTLDASKTLAASSKPPAPHLIASNPSGEALSNVSPPQRVLSGQSGSKGQPNLAPSFPAQSSRPSPKGKHSSLGTVGVKPSLASTPVDEDMPSEFFSAQISQGRRPIGTPKRVLSSSSLAGYASHPAAAQTNPVHSLDRTNSYASVDYPTLRHSRSSCMMSSALAPGSDTRLASYDSRQAQNREHKKEAQKQEQLLADWRLSQQQGANFNVAVQNVEDSRRAQMLFDKEQKRWTENRERVTQQQKQNQIDQVMRRPDMQDLHREAMRKMQAGASKKL